MSRHGDLFLRRSFFIFHHQPEQSRKHPVRLVDYYFHNAPLQNIQNTDKQNDHGQRDDHHVIRQKEGEQHSETEADRRAGRHAGYVFTPFHNRLLYVLLYFMCVNLCLLPKKSQYCVDFFQPIWYNAKKCYVNGDK